MFDMPGEDRRPAVVLVRSSFADAWSWAGVIGRLPAGVVAVVLTAVGGTTWTRDGFWDPDGTSSVLIAQLVVIAWAVVVTRILTRRPTAGAGS
jgi:hypothetical protein